MKLLVLLPVLIFSLLQGVFLPINLCLLLVLIWAAFRPPKESLVMAFLSGLILDLALGTSIGLSSLIFLLTSFLVLLYRGRFDPTHFIFLPLFTFFSSLLYDWLVKGKTALVETLILTVLAIVLKPLLTHGQK